MVEDEKRHMYGKKRFSESFVKDNYAWNLNIFNRSPVFWTVSAFCFLVVLLEVFRHISIQIQPQEVHEIYKPPFSISNFGASLGDLDKRDLMQYTVVDESLPQYERVLHNDQLWEEIARLYLPNEGSCAVDCTFDMLDLATCRCFETLSDLYRRTLRMLPKSGILSIDFDIMPEQENARLMPLEENVKLPTLQASAEDVSLPYLPLYTAAMGHRSIVFTNSKNRADKLSQVVDNHGLSDHLTIYSEKEDYLHVDQLTQDWALVMRISANGKEEQVVQGAADFISNRTVTYLILRFWPEGIVSNHGSPSRLLTRLLDWDFKISLLGVGERILHDRNHDDPWKANDMITHNNVVSFIESLGDSFAYLYLTRGGDVAIPDHMTYRTYSPKKSKTEYATCSVEGSGRVSLTLKDSLLKIKCKDVTKPHLAYFITSFEDSFNITDYKKPVHIDSEYVCAKVQCTEEDPVVEKCAVENRPKKHLLENKTPSTPKQPNILVLLIDALSKGNFLNFLPNTVQTLNSFEERFDYSLLNFTDYHIVGTNSGPNQAAFFAGELVGGGDTSLKKKTADQEWIWKILKEQHGYTTLKIEDMCFKHSGLLKALGYLDKTAEPPTTHAFLEFFCPPNYRRPHCVGDKPLSRFMFDYLGSYISNYQDARPWAAFANFGEAHEDSVSLPGILDQDLNQFLSETVSQLKNTVTILVSDHGLHYGPYFQTKTGQRQHMTPFVYMLMPDDVSQTFPPAAIQNLKENQARPTTPLNVYHTMRDLIRGSVSPPPDREAETSLFLPIREDIDCNTMGVPEKYCRRTIIHNAVAPAQQKCRIARHYPSARTFTMDQHEPYHAGSSSCIMQDNERITVWNGDSVWMNCSQLESGSFWTSPNDRNIRHYLKEYSEGAVMVSPKTELLYSVCNNRMFPEQSRENLQIRNIKNTKLANLHTQKLDTLREQLGKPDLQLPDIYMINIDSASRPESLRGLRYTLEQLKELDSQGAYSYFDFSLYNTVGYNKIPNQVAALSGCVARDLKGNSLFINSDISPSRVYELDTPVSQIYQLLCSQNQLDVPNDRNVWLFQYLKEKGYVSMWGQDTCPKDGFTIQNFFKKRTRLTDHSFGSFNCEATNENFKKNSFCVAGKYAHGYTLSYLKQFNANYQTLPKFALLDLMAAQEASQYGNAGAIKALDKDLARAIEDMTNSTAPKVIFLMSYHGINHGYGIDSNSGQLEHKTPMLHVLISNELLDTNQARNFKENTNHLVTPYDIYSTIRHIVELQVSSNSFSFYSPQAHASTARSEEIPSWSHSFLEPISDYRSCDEALIPNNYCACDYAEPYWSCSYENNAPGCDCNKKSCPLRPTSYILAKKWEQKE